ncbi:MAG: glycogen/starch synthase, partial [Betaproteobacteria bacterium]
MALRRTSSAQAPLAVLAVVSELYPFVKTGGLADVAYALPLALATEGIAVRTRLPGDPAAQAAGLDLLVLDAPHLYARVGNPYL